MRMNEGVEWAAHCCITLDWLGDERPVSTAKLAAGYEVPPAYLNKQLQAMVKAGLLISAPGAKGGFRLARPLTEITLMDVVAAIEGPEEAFRCTEIRRNGPGAHSPEDVFRNPCTVAEAMREAELAWRRALASRTLADIQAKVSAGSPDTAANLRRWYGRL